MTLRITKEYMRFIIYIATIGRCPCLKKKSNIAHLLSCIEPLAVEPQNIELDFLQ